MSAQEPEVFRKHVIAWMEDGRDLVIRHLKQNGMSDSEAEQIMAHFAEICSVIEHAKLEPLAGERGIH